MLTATAIVAAYVIGWLAGPWLWAHAKAQVEAWVDR
jgi:hypothetical protein